METARNNAGNSNMKKSKQTEGMGYTEGALRMVLSRPVEESCKSFGMIVLVLLSALLQTRRQWQTGKRLFSDSDLKQLRGCQLDIDVTLRPSTVPRSVDVGLLPEARRVSRKIAAARRTPPTKP